jgi:K+-sensing histidine kinase KdpD
MLDRSEPKRLDTTAPDRPWILVPIDGTPETADLLRLAAQLAEEENGPWIAVHVVLPGREAGPEYDRSRTEEHLLLAHRLGAVLLTAAGASTQEALVAVAREYGALRILRPDPVRPRRG